MAQFTGRLQALDIEPTRVWIDIGDGRFRISTGPVHLGSWPLEKIHAERTSIYRFHLDINGDEFEFYPDDPTNFADSVGAIIDLTAEGGRFGLKGRIRQSYSID